MLSTHPRIGKLEERVAWFRQYGVRECWLIAHLAETVQVLQFQNGEAKSIRSFGLDDPIASGVLPEFRSTLRDITGY